MDDLFLAHNVHWQSVDLFLNSDPQLRGLKMQPFVFEPDLVKQLPTTTPGVYTIGGGRQIGKTTLLKQWMEHLLTKRHPVDPRTIFFLTGEVIQDHITFIRAVKAYLEEYGHLNVLFYVLVDEVTYIKDWDQGVKFLADAGFLENVVMVLTGSDLSLMQEARKRFPGRRGCADIVDFHFNPLSFFECVQLKHGPLESPSKELLFKEFGNYLQHGGFLTAINSVARNGYVLPTIHRTYSDWIRGDVLKRGKSEESLRDFVTALLKTYGSQVTWNALGDHMAINHPQTIQNYAYLLASMDVLFVQSALIEDKLLGAPKKAKKLIIKDPFIYHAIHSWLHSFEKPFLEIEPHLVESIVVSHYNRFYPCFYIKAKGEVDLAYLNHNKFFPIEVKWTSTLRPKDLSQIKKYPSGLILTKTMMPEPIEGVPTEFLPLHLYDLGKKMKGTVSHFK
jgi:predicted AAA+ superfamily ATPase